MKLHLGVNRETKYFEVKNALVMCVYTMPLFYALVRFPKKWEQINKASMKTDVLIRSTEISEV
jgi:hypothetical protein